MWNYTTCKITSSIYNWVSWNLKSHIHQHVYTYIKPLACIALEIKKLANAWLSPTLKWSYHKHKKQRPEKQKRTLYEKLRKLCPVSWSVKIVSVLFPDPLSLTSGSNILMVILSLNLKHLNSKMQILITFSSDAFRGRKVIRRHLI